MWCGFCVEEPLRFSVEELLDILNVPVVAALPTASARLLEAPYFNK